MRDHAWLKDKLVQFDTVTEAAKKLGVSRTHLSAVLSGKYKLSMEIAVRINVIYGITTLNVLYDQVFEEYNSIKNAISLRVVKDVERKLT